MTATTVLKQDKTKAWNRILQNLRNVLARHEKINRTAIQTAATQLENKGMPLNMICSAIVEAVKDFVGGTFVRESLDQKYKQEHRVNNRKQRSSNVGVTNVSNNVSEQAQKKPTKNAGKAKSLPIEETSTTEENESKINWQLEPEESDLQQLLDLETSIHEFSPDLLLRYTRALINRVKELEVRRGSK